MRIAPIVCAVFLCALFVSDAHSFKLTKKLIAVKAPIVAAKVHIAKDVKHKAAAVVKKVALKALDIKKKAAVVVATPIIAIKALKKKIIAKKLFKIGGAIIALKTLKKTIIEKKLDTLKKIIPVAAGLGLGKLAHAGPGFAFTEFNGAPIDVVEENFVLVPEEYRTFNVEESYPAPSGFLRNTLNRFEYGLQTIGNSVPFLNTLTNGVKAHPAPIYKFVPDLGFHKYHTVHYRPDIEVSVPSVPVVPEIDDSEEIEVIPPQPEVEPPQGLYPPELPTIPEIPEVPEFPHETYGPPAGYGIPSASIKEFQIPSTSYGHPQGPTFRINNRTVKVL